MAYIWFTGVRSGKGNVERSKAGEAEIGGPQVAVGATEGESAPPGGVNRVFGNEKRSAGINGFNGEGGDESVDGRSKGRLDGRGGTL